MDAELAGETVVVWWGLFDQELWVERGDERFGPFHPVGGAIPLHRYRKHRKSRRESRAEQVAVLADKLVLPRAAVTGENDVLELRPAAPLAMKPFQGPDPFHELAFPNQGFLAQSREIFRRVLNQCVVANWWSQSRLFWPLAGRCREMFGGVGGRRTSLRPLSDEIEPLLDRKFYR